MANYTTTGAVESYLGTTLTTGQQAEAATLLPVADAFIDDYTGTTWNTSAAVTDERHDAPGARLYLRRAPVTAVTTVTARQAYVGAAATTLVAGQGYELLDATRGVLRLAGGWGDYEIRVTYTPAVPLDTRIARAATLLVAHWLTRTLTTVSSDVKSYSIGQELTVEYRDSADLTSTQAAPPDALALLDSAKPRRAVFA